jgi:hypothetical protein
VVAPVGAMIRAAFAHGPGSGPALIVRVTRVSGREATRRLRRGGTVTDPMNGVLLCWYPQHSIDTSGWRIRMIRGKPQVAATP